jgi:hypothetical protein
MVSNNYPMKEMLVQNILSISSDSKRAWLPFACFSERVGNILFKVSDLGMHSAINFIEC